MRIDQNLGRSPNSTQSAYSSRNDSGPDSMAFSFSSDSSWSDEQFTPPSTRRGSCNARFDETAILGSSPFSMHSSLVGSGVHQDSVFSGMSPMSLMTQESILNSAYLPFDMGAESKMVFDENTMEYHTQMTGPYVPLESQTLQQPLAIAHSNLEHGLLTPNSTFPPSPENFVDPCSTNYNFTYDAQSPMKPLQFDEDFDLNTAAAYTHMESSRCFYKQDEDLSIFPTTLMKSTNRRLGLKTEPSFEGSRSIVPNTHRARKDKDRKTRKQVVRRTQRVVQHNGPKLLDNMKVEAEPTLRCSFENCTSKFGKLEHLTRHEKTKHGPGDYGYPVQCPFCALEDKPKAFKRSDNYKTHARLHAVDDPIKKKMKRTTYFPEAKTYCDILCQKGMEDSPLEILEAANCWVRTTRPIQMVGPANVLLNSCFVSWP